MADTQKYYVLWADGRRFGPCDEETLLQWAKEGRITPYSELENADTGARLSAETLLGPWTVDPQLQQPVQAAPGSVGASAAADSSAWVEAAQTAQPQAPVSQPTFQGGGGPYPPAATPSAGMNETTWAWICCALSLCCGVAAIAALVLAIIGMNKKQNGAVAALVVSGVMCLLTVVGTVVMLSGAFRP